MAQFPSEMGKRRGRERGQSDPGRDGAARHQGEARARDQGQREMTIARKGRLAVGLIGARPPGPRLCARSGRPHCRRRGWWPLPIRSATLAQEVAAEFDVAAALHRSAGAHRRPGGRRHRHRQPRRTRTASSSSRRRQRGQADVLREAAGAVARRGRGDAGGDRAVRHLLPDGIHAAVRRRLRRREEADRSRAHRHAAGLQVDVARSVPPEPRVRQSRRAAAAC